MRPRTRLGFGLLVVGCAVILVSSGAFDAMTANRTADLATTTDDNALLGVEYPNGRNVTMDATGGNSICFWRYCYYSEELFRLTDGTANGNLSLVSSSYRLESGGNPSLWYGPSESQSASSIATVSAGIRCRRSQGGGPRRQVWGQRWLEMDAVVSDGNTTIELTRRIELTCLPE